MSARATSHGKPLTMGNPIFRFISWLIPFPFTETKERLKIYWSMQQIGFAPSIDHVHELVNPNSSAFNGTNSGRIPQQIRIKFSGN